MNREERIREQAGAMYALIRNERFRCAHCIGHPQVSKSQRRV